jgi:hypothetical protein
MHPQRLNPLDVVGTVLEFKKTQSTIECFGFFIKNVHLSVWLLCLSSCLNDDGYFDVIAD